MQDYTQYAEKLAQRYSLMERAGKPAISWEEGYVPLSARRAPLRAVKEMQQFQESVVAARKRVRIDQVKELLEVRPEYKLLTSVPFGAPTSIDEVLRRERRLVLLSEAGAGKTTALRYVAAQRPLSRPLATEEGEVERLELLPVVVALKDVAGRSLPEYLSADAQQQMSLEAEPEFFEDLLASGQLVVCLDELDEISDPEQRAATVRQIESWVDEFPKARYVITARSNAYNPELSRDDFTHYVLSPWNEDIRQEQEQAWNQALENWIVEDSDRPFYTERQRMWQHLALGMLVHNRRSATMEEAQDWLVQSVLDDPQLRLNRRRAPREVEMLLEQGLPALDLLEREEGQVSFASRLLQETLAARALETVGAERDVKVLWELIQPHLSDSDWQETLAMMSRFLAQDHPKVWNRFAAHVLEIGESDRFEPVLRRHLLFAASALGDPADELDRATRRRILDGLLDWMTDVEAVGREEAFDALLHLASEPYAIEQIFEKAADESLDAWSREAVLLLLGRLGGARPGDAIEILQGYVDDAEGSERLRLTAAMGLGALGRSEALGEDRRTEVEARLLGRVQDPGLPIDLRTALCEGLSLVLLKTQTQSVQEALIGLARNENEGEEKVPYSVQTAAADALSLLARKGANGGLIEHLWGIVDDEEVDDSVRSALALTLGKIDDAARASQVLMDLVHDPKIYPPGKRDALKAIAEVGYAPDSVVNDIVEIAETQDRTMKDFVRLEAGRTLGELGYTASCVQHLLMLVADKSIYRSTRNEALAYLAEVGFSGDQDLDDAVLAVLQIWLTEENTTEDVRERAMQSLVELRVDREDVLRDVIGVIQDKGTYPRVRRRVAEMLNSMSVTQKDLVVEALDPVLYDPEEKSDLLRVPIARLLWLWSEEQPALDYIKAAAEKSYMAQVRYNASMWLLGLGEMETAVTQLLKLVQDPSISDVIRHDSIRALGLWEVGNLEIADTLLEVAGNPELESNVRDIARASLKTVVA